ncbi:MAG: hypothetical protein K8I27_11330 [Planctomycetes bacterium]|nr:hypothetical protein [Planctomycetota bacterium]
MGPIEVEVKPSVVLKVALEEGDWKEVATALSLKLMKLKGVSGATIGEQGTITLTYKDAAPDEEEVKKLVKNTGMKFLSLAPPTKDEIPEPKE